MVDMKEHCEMNIGMFGKSDFLQIQNVYFKNITIQLKNDNLKVD